MPLLYMIFGLWTRSPFTRLYEIKRYSSWPTLKQESVAEHCFFVALHAWQLAEHFNAGAVFKETPIDVEVVLKRALAHDLDEALTGDFIRPFKYSSRYLKEALDNAARDTLQAELLRHQDEAELFYYWEQAKERDAEGDVIRLADLWSVVFYARRELMLGNRYGAALLQEVAYWIKGYRQWTHEHFALYADALAIWALQQRNELTDPNEREYARDLLDSNCAKSNETLKEGQ